MKSILKKLVVVGFSTLVASCAAQSAADLDAELLQALKYNRLGKFTSLLEKGANPNAVLGPYKDQWVMCEAIREERIEFLKVALEHGADVNLRNNHEGANSFFSAPVFCNFMHNPVSSIQTLELLIENGIDLDIAECQRCEASQGHKETNRGGNSMRSTPIMSAVASDKWRSVLRLIDYRLAENQDFPWREINYMIWNIEIAKASSFTKPVNVSRAMVTERLRSLGYTINPGVGIEKSQIQRPNWGEPAVF
jgi:hypothetical protein